MADPRLIQQSYSAGMKRDMGREALSQGVLWNEVDFIPDVLNSRQRKRGGWANASATLPTGGYAQNGVVAEYSNGQSHLVHASTGHLYEIESATSLESIGSPGFASRSVVFYNDKAIFFDQNGIFPPIKVTRASGTHTQTVLLGSPPAGKYGLIYKDVTWIMNTAAFPKRIYFSVAGNPESYDLTNKFLDNSYPITGAAALANAVLVFSLGRTMRVRGSIPPPDTDFVVDDPQFEEQGCTDNRSIANYRDRVVWANASGLWITDGTALEDLTRICGMKSWWRDVMLGQDGFTASGAEYDPSTWTIAGGVYGDYYCYSIHNSTNLIDSGIIDLTKFTWYRQDNLRAAVFYKRLYPAELFFGRRDSARLGTISDTFEPGAANTADGNGEIVEPYFETGFFEAGGDGMKTMRRVYLGHDMRDTLSNAPTLTISYATDPAATAYTALSPVFGPTTEYTRDFRQIGIPARGIAFKVAQAGRSDDTRLYTLSLDAQAREAHR